MAEVLMHMYENRKVKPTESALKRGEESIK
jgi:hypothetical protein